MIKVAIAGIAGRMGRMLAAAIERAEGIELVGGIESPDSAAVGQTVGQALSTGGSARPIESELARLPNFDLLIDFTVPDATLAHLAYCQRQNLRAVVGTTGFTDLQQEKIKQISKTIGVVHAHNYSVGLTILLDLVERASARVGIAADTEIVEWHHNQKIDAPSGTAFALLDAVKSGREQAGLSAGEVMHGREGHTGQRTKNEIGMHALRGGDVVGEHHVLFALAGERIELTHRASDRANFAEGAVLAARWLMSHKTLGLFDMRDVLDIKAH